MQETTLSRIASTTILEMLSELEEEYKEGQPERLAILQELLEEPTFQNRLIGIMRKRIDEIAQHADFEVYLYASGQKELNGRRVISGFINNDK